jgi:hypothetical protein
MNVNCFESCALFGASAAQRPLDQPGQILPSEEIKDKRNNKAENKTRSQRKIKGKIPLVDIDVAGQPPQPRELRAESEQHPEQDENQAEKDKRPAEGIHERKPSDPYYQISPFLEERC